MNLKPQLGDLYGRVMAEELQLMGDAEDGSEAVDLVKAVWVLNAYVRFLPFFGLSITLAGITKSRDTENTTSTHRRRNGSR